MKTYSRLLVFACLVSVPAVFADNATNAALLSIVSKAVDDMQKKADEDSDADSTPVPDAQRSGTASQSRYYSSGDADSHNAEEIRRYNAQVKAYWEATHTTSWNGEGALPMPPPSSSSSGSSNSYSYPSTPTQSSSSVDLAAVQSRQALNAYQAYAATRNTSAPKAQALATPLFSEPLMSLAAAGQSGSAQPNTSFGNQVLRQTAQALIDDYKASLQNPRRAPSAPADILRNAASDIIKDLGSAAYQQADPMARVNMSGAEIVGAWASMDLHRVTTAYTRPLDSYASLSTGISASASTPSSQPEVSSSAHDAWMNNIRRQIELCYESIQFEEKELEGYKRDLEYCETGALGFDREGRGRAIRGSMQTCLRNIQNYRMKISDYQAQLRNPPAGF